MGTAPLRLSTLALASLLVVVSGCKPRDPYAGSRTYSGDGPAAMPTFVDRLGLKMDGELTVTGLEPVSPGCIIGLRVDDRLTKVNGVAVSSLGEVEAAAEANLAGDYRPWCFTVVRDRQEMRIPGDCNFSDLASARKTRDYQCDPNGLTFCGPLPTECSGL